MGQVRECPECGKPAGYPDRCRCHDMVDVSRCDPVEMRKNLVTVNTMKRAGVDFVPMPVLNPQDKNTMLTEMVRRIEALEGELPDGK